MQRSSDVAAAGRARLAKRSLAFPTRSSIGKFIFSVEKPRHVSMRYSNDRSGGRAVVYVCNQCRAEVHWSKVAGTKRYKMTAQVQGKGCTIELQDEPAVAPPPNTAGLETANRDLSKNVDQLEEENHTLKARSEQLVEENRALLAQNEPAAAGPTPNHAGLATVLQVNRELCEKLEQLAGENHILTTKNAAVQEEVHLLRVQLADAQEEVHLLKAQNEQFASVQESMISQNGQFAEQNRVLKEQAAGAQYMNEKCKRLEHQVAELQRNYQEIRRASHNTIQELRGNVRVVVRARPPQGPGGTLSFGSDGARLAFNEGNRSQSYEFDRVFGPSSTQDEVFQELAGQVQSAIDGYNVALFTYGQTGAGKTHTMLGSGTGPQRGVIPRALKKIFQETSVLSETGWTFKVQVSAVQVFKEEVHDLLCTGDLVNLSYQVAVQELTTSQVSSSVEALDLLTRATGRRNTAITAMNQSSSRSHFVFMVRVVGSHPDHHDSVDGLLYFVDLAGSENAGRSQVSGERLEEAKAINKSLCALSSVFNAIAHGQQHVPYRDSRLTRLLQPCLSNGGKVQMVINLSADADSARETSQSLRFAATVKSCALGKSRKRRHREA